MNIGTWLFTRLKGRQFGTDVTAIIYYEEKRQRPGSLRNRRWVAYAGPVEASSRPAGVARLAALHDRRAIAETPGASPGRSRICQRDRHAR